MAHQIIGTVRVSPDEAALGQSILVQVFDPNGNSYNEDGSVIVTIDGQVGTRRYLQFARPGHKLIHITAASDGTMETAIAEVIVKPVEGAEERMTDENTAQIHPLSMQDHIANLPLLHAATTHANPYRVAFSVGGHALFKRGLVKRRASMRRVGDMASVSTYTLPSTEEHHESSFDGFSVHSGITGELHGTQQMHQVTQHHVIGHELPLEHPVEAESASHLNDAIMQTMTKYQWDFGDGHVETTESLRIAHDFGPSLDPLKPYQLFDVSVCIQKPDGSAEEVKRTLTIHNAYSVCRNYGTIVPPTESVEFAELDGLGYSAWLRIRNVESYPLVLSEHRFRVFTSDSDQSGILGENLKLNPPIVIPALSTKEISVHAPFDQVPRRSAGFTAYYFGATEDDQLIRVEATFDTRIADREGSAVTIGNGLAVGNLPGYERLRKDEAVTSQLQAYDVKDAVLPETMAAIAKDAGATGEILPTNVLGAQAVGQVLPAQPVEGAVCDPDNLPGLSPEQVNEGWSCQATAEIQEVFVPARFMNAMKGDIVLVPGGELIGGMLRQVVPPQRYDHCGIMTRNFDQITHSTASQDRLLDYPNGSGSQPTDGFKPEALKYMWPGVVTQSVEDTIFGEMMVDPNSGKTYEIGSFNPGAIGAEVAGVWEIIPPLVVKPDPQLETAEIRNKLHQVADEALAQTGKSHYRLYCYSDPTLSQRPEGIAPASAGWAAGTYPSVCSSFIWMVLKRQGINLEGQEPIVHPSELESLDVAAGAQVENTRDGLYLYTAEERKVAAEWLKEKLVRLVEETLEDEAGVFGDTVDFFTDIADDVSNQMLNTFASDWADTAAKDSEAWRNIQAANAVSPDNILLWDGPPAGLYGHVVPLSYRSPRLEQVVVHRWKRELKQGVLRGKVYYKGRPVNLALVQLYDGKTVYSDSAGAYEFQGVPLGTYELKAYKNALEHGIDGSDRVRAVIDKAEQTIDLNLVLPADYRRRLAIEATIETTDDEVFGDEHAKKRYFKEVFVGPWDTHEEVDFVQRMGGEIRIELHFDVDLNRDRSVSVTASAKMFEGATESTDDLDDTEKTTIVVAKDEKGYGFIQLYNEGFGGGDKSDISFSVFNRLAN